MARTLSLIVRNLVFTVVVPGLGGVWVPWWILTRHGGTATPVGYEERTLSRRFGRVYLEYRRTVPRWIPRRPRPS
jgi:protein-S-isoprenylcysteine O-methyltransferase Ste14